MTRTIELTPEQIRTLKLFSYYCINNASDEVKTELHIYECTLDSDIYGFHGYNNIFIEGYEKINDLLMGLINEYNLQSEPFEECTRAQLEIKVDCKERKLLISGMEVVYITEGDGSGYETERIEKDEELSSFFDEMKSKGMGVGFVDFDGGGDSGYINEKMTIDGDDYEIPAHVQNVMYKMIQSNFGGWEMDEGSFGNFEFDFDSKELYLNIEKRMENWEDVGLLLYAEF